MYERIMHLCKENNTTITALCVELTGSKGNLATWKKGNIKAEILHTIAKRFNVSVDYLLGKSPIRHGEVEVISVDEEYVPVPVIGNVAAGHQAYATTDIIGYELVSSNSVSDGYEYAWLKVKGDSMSPLILNGDLVLIRLQEEVDSGDIAVVIVDEENGVIKRVKYGTNKVTLISENADEYPPRVFQGKDISRVRIWGKAVDLRRKLS